MYRAIARRSLLQSGPAPAPLRSLSRLQPSVSKHGNVVRSAIGAPLSTTSPSHSPPPSPPLPPSSSDPAQPPSSGSGSMSRRVTVAFVSGLVLGGAIWYSSESGLISIATARSKVTVSESNRHYSTATTNTITTTDPTLDPSLRKVVAVDEETLYAGTLPISKKLEDSGRTKVLAMLTPGEATQKLRQLEESYSVGRGMGVWRYDVVQIPSNNPIEDDHAEKIIEVPYSVAEALPRNTSTDWMFWGVFDGHAGWTTSAKLRQVLIGFVARELNETYKAALADPKLLVPTPESIDQAIRRGFVRLDNEIVHAGVDKVFKNPSKLFAAEALAPALSGSCALLAFYESRSQLLRVACTGDSRAVLGRKGESGKWSAMPLSVDQTGSNEQEAARLQAEHPGEPNVVRNGRVLGGLEPTRAFGDATYKWSYETQLKIKNSFLGRTPYQLLKTPPYVTAEPVVTTTKIEPEKGDFVVLATDGLWEMLTNEEVVGLVGRWLEEQNLPSLAPGTPPKTPAKASGGILSGWFGGSKGEQQVLPVEPPAEEAKDKHGNTTPIRMLQWGVTAKDSERFVFEDKNAATHLVRNALGGKDKDMVCALLTLVSPYSRRYRDDLTVEVIFFGSNGDKTGNVAVNEEATAMHNLPAPLNRDDSTAQKAKEELKAKL